MLIDLDWRERDPGARRRDSPARRAGADQWDEEKFSRSAAE
jgi:hypothetical protein